MLLSIDQLKEKHAKELADLTRKLAIREVVPGEPISMSISVDNTRARVNYRARTLGSAYRLAGNFSNYEAYAVYTTGCTYIEPMARVPAGVADDSSRYVEFPDGNPHLRIESNSYGARAALSFFSTVTLDSGERVTLTVTIDVPSFPIVPARVPVYRRGSTQVITGYRTKFPVPFLECLRLHWSTSPNDQDSETSFFWPYVGDYDYAMLELLKLPQFAE